MSNLNQKRLYKFFGWLLALLIPVLVALFIYVDQIRRADAIRKADIEREKQRVAQDEATIQANKRQAIKEARPKIRILSVSGPHTRGITHIKIKNESLSKSATLHYLTLTINDPVQLRQIKRVHPKPKEQQASAPIDHDDGRSFHGKQVTGRPIAAPGRGERETGGVEKWAPGAHLPYLTRSSMRHSRWLAAV